MFNLYRLFWFTEAGIAGRTFPTFDEAKEWAEGHLVDEIGIAGEIIPNHPALEEADDRLWEGPNKYAGISRF